MEERRGAAGQGLRDTHVFEQFKRNDEVFRNTMEAIFQKYSNLDEPGPDVCFKTMTFSTSKGVVPLQSAEAERELQHLRNRAEQSVLVLDYSKDDQMDVTQSTENDIDSSLETENGDVSMWHGTESSQLSVNSVSGSRSCLWDLSQPEEEDEDLERTLNSHNKTLLDIYPSMLNQIGEVYRRQHVTKAASAVLRRYRRQCWHSSQAQSRNHVLSKSFKHTANRTMESSVFVQKLPHNDITSYHEDESSSSREALVGRSSLKPSPMKINKNSFLASSRSNQELSPLMTKRTLSLASIRSSPEMSSLRAMRDLSTASTSKHLELSPLTTKRNVSLATIRSSRELSPLKAIRNASLATSSSSQELSPLKAIRNASLATSSSRELSPLKAIRNASFATTSNQEFSPVKTIHNSPFVSSACFYSPRRADGENSPACESRSQWKSSGLHLNRQQQHQPVRVLDLSTPPSSAYDTQLDWMPDSSGFLPSAVLSHRRSMPNSPLKVGTSVSLTGQGGRPLIPSSSHHCASQLGQQFSGAFVERECFHDHEYSSIPSPRKTLTVYPSFDGRSPLKRRVFSLEQEQPTSSMYYSEQTVPVNHTATLQTYKPPYRSQQEVSSSPYRSPRVLSDRQENHAMSEVLQHSTKLTKLYRSFSDNQSTSSFVSNMCSRQIDGQFRSLYHYFICRGNSPSCRTSSCHLCERQSQTGDQKPSSILSNVSALALTPVGSQMRKRRRQPEVEESTRIKRFRESCSPKQQQQQQFTKYTSPAVANPTEEKRIWNRALLLQCPSPGFLRASGSTRKSSKSQTSLQNHSYSPSWRDTSSFVHAAEATSPVRACNQSGVSLSPSVSRRRLIYGPLQ
uniref:Si:dkeyp-117h8.4 n=1 Tax=Astyanax mexicanus TaxID=7994 RepID=A0A3B1JZ13_ASTMX